MDSIGENVQDLWRRSNIDGLELLRLGLDDFLSLETFDMNKTMAIIDRFALGQVKQLRYMHIGFGSLSSAMALLMIVRIWYDSWRAQQLSVRLRPRRWAFLYELHSAESFPLVLGFVILSQQLAFVGIQATALNKIFVRNCRPSGSLVFAEIFVLGWFHLTFGLDMTIRSLRPQIIAPRRKVSIIVCTGAALVLSTAGWLSTKLQPPRDKCFGDMIFRSIKSAWLGVSLCVIMIPSFLLMALIIGLRLYRTVLMDHNERIAGTRMVYYLVLTALLYVLVLPFWIQAITGTFDFHLTSSRVAEFVLFISGTIVALVHFFLRANAARTAIRPKSTPWGKRRRFRFFGPSDLELMTISPPIMKADYETDEKISPWKTHQDVQPKIGMLSSPTATTPGSMTIFTINHESTSTKPGWPLYDRSPAQPSKASRAPKLDTPNTPITPTHRRNQPSYSLFPGMDEIRLPPTVYSPENKSAPKSELSRSNSTGSTAHRSSTARDPSLPKPAGLGRGRSNSADSTATLHIGMRFSSAPSALAVSGASLQQPPQLSLRDVIDSIRADPFANKPLPEPMEVPSTSREPPRGLGLGSAINLTPRSYQTPSERSSPSTSNGSQRNMASLARPMDYAWLDISDSSKSVSTVSSAAVSSRPTYLSRQDSRRQLAEVNRQEMANLERSGSGSKARSRPVYPHPGTPDDATKGEGFF